MTSAEWDKIRSTISELNSAQDKLNKAQKAWDEANREVDAALFAMADIRAKHVK